MDIRTGLSPRPIFDFVEEWSVFSIVLRDSK